LWIILTRKTPVKVCTSYAFPTKIIYAYSLRSIFKTRPAKTLRSSFSSYRILHNLVAVAAQKLWWYLFTILWDHLVERQTYCKDVIIYKCKLILCISTWAVWIPRVQIINPTSLLLSISIEISTHSHKYSALFEKTPIHDLLCTAILESAASLQQISHKCIPRAYNVLGRVSNYAIPCEKKNLLSTMTSIKQLSDLCWLAKGENTLRELKPQRERTLYQYALWRSLLRN